MKLTLQKFYRVTGSSTQHLGVSPDVNLPSAFDAKEFGESANISALPWDQIKGTKFNMTKDVSSQLLAKLNDGYSQRLKNDADLKELVAETSELKQNLSKTVISLNEVARKKEMDEAEKRRNDRQASNMSGTKIEKEPGEDKDAIDENDRYLKEGIIILTQSDRCRRVINNIRTQYPVSN